jgi:hypothetical protein
MNAGMSAWQLPTLPVLPMLIKAPGQASSMNADLRLADPGAPLHRSSNSLSVPHSRPII